MDSGAVAVELLRIPTCSPPLISTPNRATHLPISLIWPTNWTIHHRCTVQLCRQLAVSYAGLNISLAMFPQVCGWWVCGAGGVGGCRGCRGCGFASVG